MNTVKPKTTLHCTLKSKLSEMKSLRNSFKKSKSSFKSTTSKETKLSDENMIAGLIILRNWDYLSVIIDKFPSFAKEKINIIENQKIVEVFPIHEISKRQPSLEVVKSLLRAFPESIYVKDEKGRLLLHLLCRNGSSQEVISYVVKAYPFACKVEDKHGLTPLGLLRTGSQKRFEDETAKLLSETCSNLCEDSIEEDLQVPAVIKI